MTTEEAIKWLEYDKAMCLFNPMTGKEKPMSQLIDWSDYDFS